MRLEIYKKGQGKYARGLGYLLGGLLILFGAVRLFATINVPDEYVWIGNVPVIGAITAYNVGALLAFLGGMLLLHLVLNKPSNVDLLVDTEQEMKKVSWPSRREVYNATLVVVFVTFALAIMLFGFDKILQFVFGLFVKV